MRVAEGDALVRRSRLGWLLTLAGLGLLAIGLLNVSRLLGAPLEAQRGYLAQTVVPLVVGL